MTTHQDLIDNLMCKFNGVQIGKATLFNCDCNDFMACLPDKSFELSCVDPPYGLGDKLSIGGHKHMKFSERYRKSSLWDVMPPDEYFSEVKRVSKNQIIWGGNYFSSLGATRGYAVWDKIQPVPNFSATEFAWSSFDVPSKIFRFNNNQHDIGGRIHPTQKPVKLYEWLLTNYAKPGQRILDTHLGSMSSVIACLNMGFEIVGCELDADYFKAGVERVKDSQKQQKLEI